MLGQPISMLIPAGARLPARRARCPRARRRPTSCSTITERLRKHGVVGKFVEFFGPGLEHLTIADRATLGNMCPEYGATIAIFPIDEMTLDYLRLTGRDESRVAARRGVREGAGAVPHGRRSGSGLLRDDRARSRDGRAEPRGPAAAAGSRVAQAGEERVPERARRRCRPAIEEGARRPRSPARRRRQAAVAVAELPAVGQLDHGVGRDRRDHELHQHVESERDDRRRAAREEGGRARPDAQAVGEDQPGARLEGRHRVPAAGRASTPTSTQLGFNLVGYGCTTCIGNSGPLPDDVSAEVEARNLVVASVLSGNRNFEGRIQQQVRANYLASPPLVVAYALAGRDDARPDDRAARHRHGRRAGLPARHLADRARDSGDDAPGGQRRRCSASSTPTCSAATSAGGR